jgi:anti-sigma-K factor RskA
MRYSSPELVERLAAEYVLGSLHGGARRRFVKLMAERADIRLSVWLWQSRLSPLAESVAPVSPPAQVWQGISQRTLPKNQEAPQKNAPLAAGWNWLKPSAWGLSGLLTGIGLTAALLFTAPTLFFTADQIAMRTGEKLPQSYVGVLTDAQGNGRLLVSSLRHGKTVTLKVLGAGELGSASEPLQLWALPADGAPFLLANVPAKGSASAQLADTSEKLLSKVSKLAVTRVNVAQPGAPGEIVLSGNCAKLW